MTKAVEMARVSLRGGFNVFWGMAASTIISAVGVIIIARVLSPSEYGLVAIVWVAPTLIQNFRDFGMNYAMIKYTAQHRSEGKVANLKTVAIAGFFFELAVGGALSLVSFFLSGYLAANVFNRASLEPFIQIASLTIFTGALLTTAQSVFTGFERMELYSATMLLQSILKAVLASLLAILGLGVLGVIVGTTAASLIAGVISVVILYIYVRKKVRSPNDDQPRIVESAKKMFRYGLPLSISLTLLGFRTQFYNFLMAIYVADYLIGNYKVALNFAVLITFFSTPVATMLFPAFSKINAKDETETLRNIFQFSVKLSAFLVVPAAAAVIALSKPAIYTLFGEQYGYAPLYLALVAIAYLYSAFGNLSVGNLINSQGKTQVTLKLSLVSSAIGFPLSLLLIPRFGVIGLVVTSLITAITGPLIGLWWISKHFKVTIDWVSSAKILLAGTFAAAITYAVIYLLTTSYWVELVIGTTIFLITYLTTAPMTGAISRDDLINLREMLKALGPLSRLFNPLLAAIEKLVRAR